TSAAAGRRPGGDRGAPARRRRRDRRGAPSPARSLSARTALAMSPRSLERPHFGQHPVAEEGHAFAHPFVGDVADLHVDEEAAVAELLLVALDLLHHRLGAAAQHRSRLDLLVEIERGDGAEPARIALADALVLEIARLLHDEAERV